MCVGGTRRRGGEGSVGRGGLGVRGGSRGRMRLRWPLRRPVLCKAVVVGNKRGKMRLGI